MSSTAVFTFYLQSELRKKEKNLYQFFIQKLRVRVMYECVIYSNKYGKFPQIGYTPVNNH